MSIVSSTTFSPKFQYCTGGSHILNSGFDIPLIGLGTSRIGDGERIESSIRAALEAGYRLFDTAHIYQNEKEIGETLEKCLVEFGCSREDIFITTKVALINENTAQNVERMVNESLEKLNTEYLDLVLIHFPRERAWPQDVGANDDDYEVNARTRKLGYQKLEELRAKGVIRSIGVSNFEVYHLQELLEYASVVPAVNQIEYHPYYTRPQLKHFCSKHRIFLQAFSSLCWGNLEILNEEAVKKAAAHHNVSPQIILYAFGPCTGVGIIPKSSTPLRVHDNLKLTSQVKLSAEEIKALQELDRNLAFCPQCNSWRVL